MVQSAVADAASPWSTGIRQSWGRVLPGRVWAAPDGTTLISTVGLRRGTVVTAYDSDDGQTLWRRVLPPDARPTLATRNRSAGTTPWVTIDHGLIAVAEEVAGLRVLDLRTGALLWTAGPSPQSGSTHERPSSAITADAVYYSSPRDTTTTSVRRLDRATGALRWEREMGGSITAADGVVLTRQPCRLEAWSATDGSPQWAQVGSKHCASNFGPAPTVARGLVLDSTGSNVLRDVDNGELVASLAASPGDRVLGTAGGRWILEGPDALAAYEDDGRVAWRLPLPEDSGTAALAGDAILTTAATPPAPFVGPPTIATVRALDAATGLELARTTPRWSDVDALAVGGRALLKWAFVEPGPAGPYVASAVSPAGSVLYVPGTTNARTVDLPFSADASGDTQCRIDDGAWSSCTSPWRSPDMGDDGDHVLEVQGAAGGPPVRHTVAVDRTAPTVTITDRPAGPVGRGASGPSFDYTADEPLVDFLCRVDPDPSSPWIGVQCNSGWYDLAGRGDGPHVLEVRARDRAGNLGPVVRDGWSEDHRDPRVTLRGPGRRVERRSFDIAFAVEDEGPVEVTCWARKHGDRERHEERGCTSPWRVDAPTPGSYRFGVEVVDQAGNMVRNEGDPVLAVTAGDVLATPTFPAFSAGGPSRYWGPAIMAINTSSTAIPGHQMDMRCRFDGGPTWVPCDSVWFAPGEGGMQARDGEHLLEVQGVMRWGLAGPVVRVPFGIDRTAPTLRFEGGTTGTVRPGATIVPPRPVLGPPGPGEAPQDGVVTCEVNTTVIKGSCGPPVIAPANEPWIKFSATTKDDAGNGTVETRFVYISEEESPEPDPHPEPTPGPVPGPVLPPTAEPETPGPVVVPPVVVPPMLVPPAAGLPVGLLPPPAVAPGWPEPFVTVPVPPGAGIAVSPPAAARKPSCRRGRAHGRRPPAMTRLHVKRERLAARIRIPQATRRRPVTVVVEVRAGCGAWKSIVVRRSRTRSLRIVTTRLPTGSATVRVRTVQGKVRATSVERVLPH